MAIARSSEIKVRITDSMKARIVELAVARDESESVIVREALVAYLERLQSKAPGAVYPISKDKPEPQAAEN